MALLGKFLQYASGSVDSTSGEVVLDKSTDGAAHVVVGSVGIAHNRNIAAAATTHPGDDTTNTATWTAAEGIKELTIDAIAATAAGLQNDEKYLIVVNAPSAAIAKTWLTDAGSASQDVVYEMGNLTEQKVIRRTSTITRVDVLPLNVNMRFVIGAV